jgi:serpin B
MVLANALYLKAPWVEAFDVARTADQTFFAATGPQTVPFLHGEMTGGHGIVGGATVVRLPLRGGSLSFVIALPAEGTDNSDVDLTAVWEALPGLSSESLALSLPKLAVTRSTNLKQSLERLGVGALFDEGQCDLSGLNDIEQLFVSGAFHKAFVGVDEKGVEAAAATAIVVDVDASPPPPVAVVVDRPFQFLIVDTALSLPLFVGAVTSID